MAKLSGKAAELIAAELKRRADSGDLLAITGAAALGAQSEDAEASFLGAGAKMADKFMLGVAEKMKSEGIMPNEIWEKTGWFEGADGKWRFEVPDNAAEFSKTSNPDAYLDIFDEAQARQGGVPLGRAFDHPEWYRNYPDMQAMKFAVGGGDMGRMTGYYSPESDYVAMKDPFEVAAGEGYTPKSTMIHEGQHAIQQREGFAKGGSPANAAMIGARARKAELEPLIAGRGRYAHASQQAGDISRAEYIGQLEKVIQSDSPRPSSVTNLSDWYKYSDEIRATFGAMPKSKAKGRDEWLRNAAQYIREKNLSEMDGYQKSFIRMMKEDPKEFSRRKRVAKREMDKFGSDARRARIIEDKYNQFNRLPEHEQYRRLAGEVEARNVQARLDMTPEERKQTPPWVTEDVPRRMQVAYRGFADPRLLAGISAVGGGAALAPAVSPYSPAQIGTALLQRGGPLMQQEAIPARFPGLHGLANIIEDWRDPTGVLVDFKGTADYLRRFGEGEPSVMRSIGAVPF